jgi:F-type H+-transporting ATPase subunit b
MEEAVGIAALGISWSAFIFQLINFLVLLAILRIFAYPAIIRVLEARKQKIDEQLQNAAEIEKRLALAHTEAQDIVHASHEKARAIIHDASKRAESVVQEAFARAEEETKVMFRAAEALLEKDVKEARRILKTETALLVVTATEKILGEKMTSEEDRRFIDRALV